MKKILLVVLLSFVLLMGCVKKEEAKKVELVFDANTTTGYTWLYEIETKGIIKVSRDEYIQDKTDSEMVGVGGKHYFDLEAVKAGTTKITFTYSQIWNPTDEDTKEVYNVVVNDDLSITATKE